MTHISQSQFRACQTLRVFASADISATSGVSHGDQLGPVDMLCAGDTYALRRNAQPTELEVDTAMEQGSPLHVTARSHGVEPAGAQIGVTATLRFMTQTGAHLDALLLESAQGGIYLHPMGPVEDATDYTLIAIEEAPDTLPNGDPDALSFVRGTKLTLANGQQCPVEQVQPGDRVLTRDHGAQPIRWVGARSEPAVGHCAPIVISKGALNNAEALLVGPSQRLMISDWRAEVLAGSRDVLIRAEALVNDSTIFRRTGGVVDYVQIVFDTHQVIYAEGIPTESLTLSRHVLQDMGQEMAGDLIRTGVEIEPTAGHTAHPALEGEAALNLLRQTGRL